MRQFCDSSLFRIWLRTRGIFLFVLVALTLVIYSHSVGSEFVWDDEFFIQENRFLQTWSGVPSLFTGSMTAGAGQPFTDFYRPMQALTHFVDVQIFGMDAWWHHLTNLALQAMIAILFFILLCRLLEGEREADIPWAAFFALSLWLFHPLQSEIVGYLSGRGDMLVFAFSGAAALAWPRHRWWAFFFCLCALLSKETGVLAPVLVVVCDYIRRRKSGNTPINALSFLPLVLLVLAYVAARMTILSFHNTLNFYGQSNILTEHYEYRVFTYLSTLGKSMQLIFWPMDLHHERSWLVYSEWRDAYVVAGFLTFFTMLLTALYARKRWPLIAAGFFWFLVAGVPTSNLIALINALIYDHWFVWPAFGLVLVMATLFIRMQERIPRGVVVQGWLLLLAPLLCLNWQQNGNWQTAEAQYKHVLSFEPKSWKIMNNLAMHYAEARRFPEAEELYQRSLGLNETAQARNNLGRLFLAQGKLDDAKKELQRAVEVDPQLYQARSGLGWILLEKGNCAEAAANFQEALKIFPDPSATSGLERAKACQPSVGQ